MGRKRTDRDYYRNTNTKRNNVLGQLALGAIIMAIFGIVKLVEYLMG